MTIKTASQKAIKKLNKVKMKNPHIDAEILLSYVLKKEKEFLLTHPEKKLTKLQLEKFNKLIKQRIKGEPVAYLVGYKYFYGNKFIVNKNVLVPRPETELMIDEVSNLASEMLLKRPRDITVIDIGTGSGNIVISLAKKLNFGHPKLSFQFVGTDVSKKALTVAKKNAKLNKIESKIRFIQGSLLDPILESKILDHKSEIIITANLPYGWKEWKNNCSMDSTGLKFEPELALYTSEKGLKLYRELFQQIKKLYTLHSKSYTLFCEIDPRQSKLISKLIKKELPKAKFGIKKDLAGLDRLTIIKLD